MLNILAEKLISVVLHDGVRTSETLPGVMARLARDEIESFPALRPHQRHVWHAFLAQLGAALLRKEDRDLVPTSESEWLYLIRLLTPDWPVDEPWSLIVPDLSKPAFLQPPVPPDTYAGRDVIATPDALDMLVTSKNHDLKSERMARAAPEDWLFALLSLQTQEGVMGAGKYGISRMNGGYGSRAGLGMDRSENVGFRFRRDVLALSRAIGDEHEFNEMPRDGKVLVWLEEWDGKISIPFNHLHPAYIEICRRVRLNIFLNHIVARDAPSAGTRIAGASELKGNTGDPWMPIAQADGKALSLGSDGFTYRKLVDLLDPAQYKLPPLALMSDIDTKSGLALIARGMTRGQGKTEGYHERYVPIAKKAAGIFARDRKNVASLAQARVAALGELRGALNFALKLLSQGGPDSVADKETTKNFVRPWLDRLEREAERDFFQDLWNEVAAENREPLRMAWLKKQRQRGRDLFDEASKSLPLPVARRYRAKVKAESAFWNKLHKDGAFKALRDHENWEKQNATESAQPAS